MCTNSIGAQNLIRQLKGYDLNSEAVEIAFNDLNSCYSLVDSIDFAYRHTLSLRKSQIDSLTLTNTNLKQLILKINTQSNDSGLRLLNLSDENIELRAKVKEQKKKLFWSRFGGIALGLGTIVLTGSAIGLY